VRTVRVAVVALAALTVFGCVDSQPSRIEPPDPDTGAMEPQVAELLLAARAEVLESGSAENWGTLGAVYDAHGLLAEAEACYRRAGELDPAVFDWVYLLAVVREVRGAETDEVVAQFDRADLLRPGYPPIRIRLGAALALRGEHGRARAAFERALSVAPTSAVAHRGLGQALLALDDAARAAEHLARAAELQPRDLSAHAGLAQAYMRLGRPEQAQIAVERSRGLQPIDAMDDPVYGARVFMRSVSSSRAFSRAQAAMRIGAWQQAVEDLALVLRARPVDASTHYWKATAHLRLEQNQPALAHLRRAVEIDPGLVAARVQLGHLLVAEGRYPEALEQFERASTLRPLDAASHIGLARAYEATGRASEAREHREAARRLGQETDQSP